MTETAIRKTKVPNADACWALLERVVASEQLRRAARQQELLFYIGKRYLKDGSDRIQEQEIGSNVFGRPDSYDTTADNIVRTNVSDLRKRIEGYFNSEGSGEKLILEIPRGSYVPVFRYRAVQSGSAENTPKEIQIPGLESSEAGPEALAIQTSNHHNRLSSGMRIAEVIIFALAICSAIFFWSRYHALRHTLYSWQYEPSVARLWSQILGSNPNTDIVISDATFGLAEALSHRTYPLEDYLSHGYVSQLQAENLSSDTKGALNRILNWNLGSNDEFTLANRILALDPLGKSIHLYSARSYTSNLVQRDNMILIGSPRSDPWDELFENRTNFVTEIDDTGLTTVVNRSPTAGEQKIYTDTGTAEYCVVAYLPSPGHNGVVLLLEGTGSEATEACGNFLLDEEQLFNFEKRLQMRTFPYFELLLKVSSLRGAPLNETIEAYRVYSKPS